MRRKRTRWNGCCRLRNPRGHRRHLAIEFLMTLADARDRRLSRFVVSRFFRVLMSMLLDIQDESNEDGEESRGYSFGYDCLYSLSIELGGDAILPVALQQLPVYLDAPEWRKHYAALVALAQIAEGCSKAMIKNLEQVVTMVLTSFQDPHPRVRWAAITAIGQLSTDLGPHLQVQYHALVLPALASAMDDFQNPRVQACAASAVINFSANCTPDILTPYLDGIVSKLLILLQNGTQMAQAEALTALASVAGSSREQFQKYYDEVMPYLEAILVNKKSKANRMLHEVRKAAVSAMLGLLRSLKLAIEKGLAQGRDGTYLKRLSDYIVPALVEGLHKELDSKIIADMLDALSNCVQISGPLLDENQVRSVLDEIKLVITASSSRMGELAEWTKAEDFDAAEGEVFDKVCDVFSALVKAFKASILPFFDELSSYLMPMLGKDKTAEERRIAIWFFVVVAGECPEAALRYYDTYLPLLLEACNDENWDVRQIAAIGLGVCAEYGGSVIKPLIGEVLSRLHAVIRHPNALHSDNVMAYDAAVSALGNVIIFHRDSIDAAQVIPLWLNCLPIKEDVLEAKAVHELLSLMVERSDAELLGYNNRHLPKIVSIFAEILCAGEDLASEQTINRIINLLRQNLKWDVCRVTDMQQPWTGRLVEREVFRE